RCLPDRHAAACDSAGAGSRALIRRQRSVTGDELDLREIDAELLGRDLRDCRAETLTEVDLAAVDRHATISADTEERVDVGRIKIAHWRRLRSGGLDQRARAS